MRLIDADEFQLDPDPNGVMNGVLIVGSLRGKIMTMAQLALKQMVDNATTVDAVEVDAIQAWLYEIAMNNTGNVSRVCEELISRLDGLRVFAKERRTNES